MGGVVSVLTKKSVAKYHDASILFDYEEMSCLIAESPVLRAYFVKYIKLGTWIEKFPDVSPEAEIIQFLYMECECVVPFSCNKKSMRARGQTARSFPKWDASSSSIDYSPVYEYSCNSRSSLSLKSAATVPPCKLSRQRGGMQSIESFSFTDFGGVDSSFSLDEMAAIFFVSIFPYFRESTMFKTFQERLFTQCESTKSIDSAQFFSDDDQLHQHQWNHAQKLVYNAAALFAEDQLFSMLSNTGWYDTHIPSIIDNNAMSISIASCSDHTTDTQEQHPLVYVNKAFETLTGYSKHELLGKSCKFLQGPHTCPEAVERIREALKHRNAVKEVLVNYKKNGKEFKNLVVLSPVFDRVGVCTHILAVQLDVTVYPASPQDVKLMQDLLALLPGMISTKLDIKIFQML